MISSFPSRTSHSNAVVQHSRADRPFGYIYAIGRIKPYFPTVDVEKEYQQLLPTSLPPGVTTEEQRLQYVLKTYPFLAREMGWAFAIGNVNSYTLVPRSAIELDALVASIVPKDSAATVYDVVVGEHAPMVGLDDHGSLPGVTVNRTFQFTLAELTQQVVSELSAQQKSPLPTNNQIMEIFDDMLQLANNTGDADEHRALNYLSVNYPEIYMAQWSGGTANTPAVYFEGVEARHSPLGSGRAIIDVIVRYVNQATGLVSRYFTAVDVTGQFPYLVSKLQPYFER